MAGSFRKILRKRDGLSSGLYNLFQNQRDEFECTVLPGSRPQWVRFVIRSPCGATSATEQLSASEQDVSQHFVSRKRAAGGWTQQWVRSFFRSAGAVNSRSAAKAAQFTAVALGRFACSKRFEVRRGFTFFRQLPTQLAARFGLPVERLGDCGRSAHLAED